MIGSKPLSARTVMPDSISSTRTPDRSRTETSASPGKHVSSAIQQVAMSQVSANPVHSTSAPLFLETAPVQPLNVSHLARVVTVTATVAPYTVVVGGVVAPYGVVVVT